MTSRAKTERAPRLSRRKMRDLLTPRGLDAASRIVLPSHLGGAGIGELHRSLLDVRGHDVELDGSKTTQVGGLGLQLILSAQKTWSEDGRSLRIVGASDGLLAGIEALGAERVVNVQ